MPFLMRLCIAFLAILSLFGQEKKPLSADDLIQMKNAGFDDGTIVTAIEANGASIDTSAQGLIKLKTAGLSQPVIAAALSAANPEPTASPTSASSATGVHTVQDGTPVRLKLTKEVTSATAKINDIVSLELDDDVKVGTALVIPKGSSAVGHVVKAEPRGRLGRSGKLEFTIDYVRAPDGTNVRLRASAGKDDTRVITGAMLLGVVSIFMKGKDVVFPAGMAISAFVDGDREVHVSEKTLAEQTKAVPSEQEVSPR